MLRTIRAKHQSAQLPAQRIVVRWPEAAMSSAKFVVAPAVTGGRCSIARALLHMAHVLPSTTMGGMIDAPEVIPAGSCIALSMAGATYQSVTQR